jgi:hypothetical protein
MKTNPLVPAVILAALVSSSLVAQAAVYPVTSLADTGSPGTLRWAIQKANGNPGSKIAFRKAGTIKLSSALPALASKVTLDGTTAPGFEGAPVVAVDFSGQAGLSVAKAAVGSVIEGLALVNARGSGLELRAPNVTVAGNYIGLDLSGKPAGNGGDGVKIFSSSRGNLIGGFDPVTSIQYLDTSSDTAFTVQPVTAWQGLRNYGKGTKNFLICGSSNKNGLLYVGPLAGGGASYLVKMPNAASTSVYGPDNAKGALIRLVGSYKNPPGDTVYNHGFVWEGTARDLPSGGRFRAINYPGATYQFTHSTMGGLAVGNADGPGKGGKSPIGPGVAYIYDVEKGTFVANVVYPGSKSNTAYGIWYNGGTKYTICGGYSPARTNNLKDQSRPLDQGRAFLVDYDSKTKTFSNWATYRFHNQKRSKTYITHFEGISSAEDGVYTMNADSVKRGSSGAVQGSWVSVRRLSDGSFSKAQWVDLNFDDERRGITSSNSVYGNNVDGLVAASEPFAFQATINIGFSLSNVISANAGNGVGVYGAGGNIIAQNYIGTDPAGKRALGNRKNGILLTARTKANLIGGQEVGDNNPTGSEGKVKPVYEVPPQGNLISGNRGEGVLVNRGSAKNTLSGNFIGTDATGDRPLGNGRNGVCFDHAPANSLIGCLLRQNPFVFYNVISGNALNGVLVNSSNNTTVQANFLGIGANNHVLIPNGLDGLNVTGSSQTTTVGGVIPLGNVISGNTRDGISVSGTAGGFVSFNTFGGGFAFGDAAPNGRNGITITATGGNQTIQTCILSGNLGNGLEIGGDASGVQVTDTACGTQTNIGSALANGGNGVLFSGTAHNNVLGGRQPSVEGRTHFSGNKGYGVAVMDGAHDNAIYNSDIGIGHLVSEGTHPAIPNALGGIYLGTGTSATTIGGSGLYANEIDANTGPGLAIIASTANLIDNNNILDNGTYGLYATGACDGSAATGNTITGNATADVDISTATGITVTP